MRAVALSILLALMTAWNGRDARLTPRSLVAARTSGGSRIAAAGRLVCQGLLVFALIYACLTVAGVGHGWASPVTTAT